MQSFEVFGCFIRHFRPKGDELPPDIKSVLQNYSINGKMNVHNLQDFLTHIQGQTEADARSIFEKAKPHNQPKGLDLLRFLFSDLNHPLSVINILLIIFPTIALCLLVLKACSLCTRA